MGREYRFDEVESSRGENSKEKTLLNSVISNIFHNLTIDEDKRSELQDLLSYNTDEAFYKTVDSMNLRILQGFHSLLREGSSASVDSFIDMLGQIGLSSFSYQKENIFFSDILHFFHNFQQFTDEKIAILPFNTGKI